MQEEREREKDWAIKGNPRIQTPKHVFCTNGQRTQGLNLAEAVNFALPDWLAWAGRSMDDYREQARYPVFAHEELLCGLALRSREIDPKVLSCFALPLPLRPSLAQVVSGEMVSLVCLSSPLPLMSCLRSGPLKYVSVCPSV